jgi:leucyl-tRNA synthetase
VNPDELIEQYGADTFRLYEMFLGPLEQSKPWDTHGIEGVFRFIRKFWRLFHDKDNNFFLSEEPASIAELKILHRTIKKEQEDIERLSLNTVVSSLMICVNELSDLKCNKRAILQELIILVSPFAPHMAEELWELAGNKASVANASFPVFDPSVLIETTFSYPVSFNGKMRFLLNLPMNPSPQEAEQAVLQAPDSAKYLEGKTPKKIILVPGKIINEVL